MQTWTSFADWASKGLLGFICMYGIHILSGMKTSIDQLNETMAQIIERTEWHSKDIEKLEQRIIRLESWKSHK